MQTGNRRVELVCCAEQEWAMDCENADVGGDFLVLQNVNVTLSNVFRRHF